MCALRISRVDIFAWAGNFRLVHAFRRFLSLSASLCLLFGHFLCVIKFAAYVWVTENVLNFGRVSYFIIIYMAHIVFIAWNWNSHKTACNVTTMGKSMKKKKTIGSAKYSHFVVCHCRSCFWLWFGVQTNTRLYRNISYTSARLSVESRYFTYFSLFGILKSFK